MNPALKLAHTMAMTRPEIWRRRELADLAREALKERDELVLEVERLRKAVRAIPRFQGMTDLA
jgi:hypothetical protein